MRILMVLPRLGKGGAEKLTCDIAIEMQQRPGVQVKVVSFDNQNEYPELTKQLDIRWIPSKVYLSPIRKNKYQIAGYQGFLNEFKPEVIHSHLFEAELISRSVNYSSAKYFTHCHDNMHQFAMLSAATFTNKSKLTEYYERSYLLNRYRKNGGNHFIAISKDVYNYFSKVLPADLRNITLLHNAINFTQYNSANNARNIHEIKLINTGSFVPKKNQIFLVEILKELKQKGHNASLMLLGSGAEMQKVKDKVNKYGLGNQVTFAGNVEQVHYYLKDANVYVHSAYYEPFGLVLLEAMAAGLPVIALDGKGNRDLINDSVNGFFIAEQNAGLFADKILALTNNEAIYQKISKNAIEFARGFDIKNYVDRLLQLYG